MNRATTILLPGLLACFLGAGSAASNEKPAQEVKAPAPPKAAVERARHNVRMLDDVYKSTIVLITDKYVNDEEDYPAGSAAIDLFGAISQKGWHDIQLIDATGEPYDPENVANDPFEKRAVEQLKGDKDYIDEIITKDGKPYLRAATPVPVVMKKCIMCHSHYEAVKPGEPIGAMIYTMPIE